PRTLSGVPPFHDSSRTASRVDFFGHPDDPAKGGIGPRKEASFVVSSGAAEDEETFDRFALSPNHRPTSSRTASFPGNGRMVRGVPANLARVRCLIPSFISSTVTGRSPARWHRIP